MIDQSTEQIVSRVQHLRREKSRVVVAIDGRGGAGKSSLARAIVKLLPKSVHIEHDWFHLPKNEVTEAARFDHPRLIAQVLSPFRSGSRTISFLRYNWGYLAGIPDGFHDTPVTIEDMEILIIEGCNTLHSSIVSHFDLRIWLNTSAEVALRRGIRRDIDEYKLDPGRVHAAWKEWSAWEDQSLNRDDRRKRADIILDEVSGKPS